MVWLAALAFLLPPALIQLALAALGMWAARGLLGRGATVWAGLAMAAVALGLSLWIMVGCDAPPRTIVHTDGREMILFPCDGPKGMVAYGLALLVQPVVAAMILLGTFLRHRRDRRAP